MPTWETFGNAAQLNGLWSSCDGPACASTSGGLGLGGRTLCISEILITLASIPPADSSQIDRWTGRQASRQAGRQAGREKHMQRRSSVGYSAAESAHCSLLVQTQRVSPASNNSISAWSSREADSIVYATQPYIPKALPCGSDRSPRAEIAQAPLRALVSPPQALPPSVPTTEVAADGAQTGSVSNLL